MKKITLLLLSFLFISVTFAQHILTYRNNALLPGDTIITEETDLVSPGGAGPAVVWDFSNMQFTGEKNTTIVSASAKSGYFREGMPDFNTILNDKGYEYFYKIGENKSEVVGLTNTELSISLSDPILKMSYPMFYGKSISDEFNGSGVNRNKSGIAISGNYSIEADAYGTLILRDRIIKDVLRTKIVETKIQINPCNIYEIKTTVYSWYAPSARYPLLGFTTREVKTNGQDPVITNSAVLNPEMCKTGILLAGSGQENTGTASLILFPNPFIEKLYYNYFLRIQVPVTIELVDMNGKTVVMLADKKFQDEGFHTGELDAVKYDLKMGVYYFRFTLGDKVIVSKVVKM
jgi:hypothetical protein